MFLPFPIFWALFDQQVCCFWRWCFVHVSFVNVVETNADVDADVEEDTNVVVANVEVNDVVVAEEYVVVSGGGNVEEDLIVVAVVVA